MKSAQRALESVPGVRKATVTLSTKKAEVTFDPAETSAEALVEAVEKAGFNATVESVATA